MSNELVKFEPTRPVDLVEVATFAITGPDSAEVAVAYRDDVKALQAEIEAGYKPHIANAHKAHKALCDELNARLVPVKIALDALNRALGTYEVQRQQAEQQAFRDAEQKAIEQAERDRAADAEAARRKGDAELARSIATAPVEEFMAPVVVARTPKTKGVAVTQTYGPEVTNLDALVKFAAGDEVPSLLRALLLQPNEKGLQGLVDQMGEGFNVPGVKRVANTPQVRSTRGRS